MQWHRVARPACQLGEQAGLALFAKKPSAFKNSHGNLSTELILKDAIRKAKEAIVFYNGLKDFARDPASRDTIDKIIKEENRHIRLLTEEIQKL